MLLEHAEQTAFQIRHPWRVNDLVMWTIAAPSITVADMPSPPGHASRHGGIHGIPRLKSGRAA